MTTFDDRERAFENKFAHDADVRFRVLARRNKAVAAWAARQMGHVGATASAYQEEILTYAMTAPDDEAVARRVADDLARAGQDISLVAVRAEMERQEASGLAQERERPL